MSQSDQKKLPDTIGTKGELQEGYIIERFNNQVYNDTKQINVEKHLVLSKEPVYRKLRSEVDD